jgi:hypothetical protein
MATAIPNSNINIPYSAFLDETTGRPSIPWLQWLMNPNIITLNVKNTVITGGSISNVTIDNSIINSSTIGLTTPAASKFTTMTAATVAISGGAINNTTIGLTTPVGGKFTDFTALNGVKGGTF